VTTPNQVRTDYTLTALLDMVKRDTMFSINCHAIGTIQSFNVANQTAKITINYKRSVSREFNVEPVLSDYPLLLDCPVVISSGGIGGLTFPIAAGDECLILFNDRDIDSWFSSGQVLPPPTFRLHSMSDGIAIVGLYSSKRSIAGYDPDKTVLFHDETRITLGSKIKIENATTDLLTVMDGLIDVIKALTTIPAAIGVPLTLGPASIAQLESYKATIGGLLE